MHHRTNMRRMRKIHSETALLTKQSKSKRLGIDENESDLSLYDVGTLTPCTKPGESLKNNDNYKHMLLERCVRAESRLRELEEQSMISDDRINTGQDIIGLKIELAHYREKEDLLALQKRLILSEFEKYRVAFEKATCNLGCPKCSSLFDNHILLHNRVELILKAENSIPLINLNGHNHNNDCSVVGSDWNEMKEDSEKKADDKMSAMETTPVEKKDVPKHPLRLFSIDIPNFSFRQLRIEENDDSHETSLKTADKPVVSVLRSKSSRLLGSCSNPDDIKHNESGSNFALDGNYTSNEGDIDDKGNDARKAVPLSRRLIRSISDSPAVLREKLNLQMAEKNVAEGQELHIGAQIRRGSSLLLRALSFRASDSPLEEGNRERPEPTLRSKSKRKDDVEKIIASTHRLKHHDGWISVCDSDSVTTSDFQNQMDTISESSVSHLSDNDSLSQSTQLSVMYRQQVASSLLRVRVPPVVMGAANNYQGLRASLHEQRLTMARRINTKVTHKNRRSLQNGSNVGKQQI